MEALTYGLEDLMASGLASIEHVVVLMLENRSFDHMLGFLYTGAGNVSPSGQPFDGLTGTESNPDASGQPVTVFKIEPGTPNAYLMPGADPGEGYTATNDQLYGSNAAPAKGTAATNQGFVTNYAYSLGWEARDGWSIVAGTTASDIMGCFTPEALPVLSALAKGYAVCDQWFSSAPTETMPNRAFACSGTSQGHMDDKTHTFTSPSIFGALTEQSLGWAIYGYTATPLTKDTFTDISRAPAAHFGLFTDFQAAAAAGTLPPFTFLEPSWELDREQPAPQLRRGPWRAVHPRRLRGAPGQPRLGPDPAGDHLRRARRLLRPRPPPWGATPPDNNAGEFGFDFTRFGVRVPTVLVSPLIAPGTVFRVPVGSTPLDHTSILKTVEQRWNLAALTARDAAAPGFGDVLTLSAPRTDDVLAGVTVPVSAAASPAAGQPSHLEEIRDELESRKLPAGTHYLPPGGVPA